MKKKNDLERAKKAAGQAAADLVEAGMRVGLGTGSTAAFFIKGLIERCKQGLKIEAVATSEKSFQLAKEGGIPLIDITPIDRLDLTVDGADEIDPQKRMIKGGGGALLREKIIATMSREMIVIVDEGKLVKELGKFPLPIEIVPFAYKATLRHLADLGFHGVLRQDASGNVYITDNGNYIFDIHFKELCANPEIDHQLIRNVPGVIETGFFFHLAGRVIVGFNDGRVEIRS